MSAPEIAIDVAAVNVPLFANAEKLLEYLTEARMTPFKLTKLYNTLETNKNLLSKTLNENERNLAICVINRAAFCDHEKNFLKEIIKTTFHSLIDEEKEEVDHFFKHQGGLVSGALEAFLEAKTTIVTTSPLSPGGVGLTFFSPSHSK